MNWNDYYQNYNKWNDNEKLERLSTLKSLGDAYEICSVAHSFSSDIDAYTFLEKALVAGIVFYVSQLAEFKDKIYRVGFNKLILMNGISLTVSEYIELEEYLDEGVLKVVDIVPDGEYGNESVLDRSNMRPATEADVREALRITKEIGRNK